MPFSQRACRAVEYNGKILGTNEYRTVESPQRHRAPSTQQDQQDQDQENGEGLEQTKRAVYGIQI